METLGGTLWCTGPKTKECYTYDPLLKKDWIFATNLKASRVYQASTVSGDGTLWLIGGIGTSSILKSTEKVVYSGRKWKVSRGPNLPHGITGGCAAPLNSIRPLRYWWSKQRENVCAAGQGLSSLHVCFV